MAQQQKTVNICGIDYRVQWREGLVVFTEESGIHGYETRISFTRDESPNWWFTVECRGMIMAKHISQMDLWLKDHFEDVNGRLLSEPVLS